MPRLQTSIEGALYDLVARGKKDTFFQRDDATSINLFDARYEQTPPYISELRTIVPRNRVQWGGAVEFEIEKAGDLLIEPTLLINLPSWYPTLSRANNKSLIRDVSGNAYGYVNGIAYFLFEKIQFYQDNLLLQEYSGDALFALRHMRGTYNSAFLEDALTGVHDGSPLAIQHAATPSQLRLRVPLPFCQHANEGGLPLCALKSQQFRLRVTLRRLEDLVECSGPATAATAAKPNPWEREFIQQLRMVPGGGGGSGEDLTFKSIPRYMMPEPTIYLENKQVYIDGPEQKALNSQKEEYIATYSRLYENRFTFGAIDYAGNPAISKRLIEGRHPAEQMYWFFRSREDLMANRLWKFEASAASDASPAAPSYYNAMKLTVAGRDREEYWSPQVWQDIEAHAKQERYSGRGIGSMNWSYGTQHAHRGPREFNPTGTLNFTSADRPTVYVELTPGSIVATSNSQMNLIVDGYGTYSVRESRGGLLYAN
jgi:hypothetical protein